MRLTLPLTVVLALFCGCNENPMAATSGDIRVGLWGGDHVRMTVAETGASIEFDCAHGTVEETPRSDAEGHFELAGTYVPEHPGPIREGEQEDRHPARYSGKTDGSTLTVTVTLLDQDQQLGPYTLTYGRTPRLFKCR
jgi:hypothetical protein